jgi:hypothetical protein
MYCILKKNISIDYMRNISNKKKSNYKTVHKYGYIYIVTQKIRNLMVSFLIARCSSISSIYHLSIYRPITNTKLALEKHLFPNA